MKKPRILDLYCGAGLASIGYHLSGFDVVGVDIVPQPHYPFRFVLSNAHWVTRTCFHRFLRKSFDFIHASPPCQAFSCATAPFRYAGKTYPDLIEVTRNRLDDIGLPYCIENVPSAPVRADISLWGYMFGLNVIRRRNFELGGWFAMQPGKPSKVGSVQSGDYCSVFGKAGYRKRSSLPHDWRPKFDQGTIKKTWAFAMGIPPSYTNFTDKEIAQGIPPAYTRWIGEQWLSQQKLT